MGLGVGVALAGRKKDSSFLKKRSKRLLLIEGQTGFGGADGEDGVEIVAIYRALDGAGALGVNLQDLLTGCCLGNEVSGSLRGEEWRLALSNQPAPPHEGKQLMPAHQRSLRNYVASVALGFLICSFICMATLFAFYHSYRPAAPDYELGLLYPSNSHGSYVYISKFESAGLTLLKDAAVASFVVPIFVVPKDFQGRPSRTFGRVQSIVGAVVLPAPIYWTIVLSGGAFAAVAACFGRPMCAFAVSHGIGVGNW